MYHKVPLKVEPASTVTKTSYEVTPHDETELEHTTMFYVGSESLGLTNLLITNPLSNVRTIFC